MRPHQIALTALLLIACNNKATTDSGTPCEVPVANAGADLDVALGSAANLDGSTSTVCARLKDAASYEWSLEIAPPGSALDASALSVNASPDAVNTSFTPDVAGDYTFSLVVSDGSNESAPDYMVVRVASSDLPPIADCGADLTGRIGESLSLDGTGSSDPEGAPLDYTWTFTDVPTCSALTSADIYNGAGATPTVVPDCDGIYTVALVVSDGGQYSEPDVCYLNIASANRIPTADAGVSVEFGVCSDNPFHLNGNGSYDLDADPLTYAWSLLTAPVDSVASDASFSDTAAADPEFTWDVAGTYVFQLQVSDGAAWSSPDIVSFTVDNEALNRRPVANAGADVNLDVEVDCESSSYVWTCGECESVDFELDGSATFDADGDRLSYLWSEPTGSVRIRNPFGAITEAVIPGQPAEFEVAHTMNLTVSLTVEDCAASDQDELTVTYSCTGVQP
jgi:hypothetical protein